MSELQPGRSEPNFDQFLEDSINRAERQDGDIAQLHALRQTFTSALKENGVHLLIGVNDQEKQTAEAATARSFQLANRQRILDEYTADSELQAQLGFKEHLDAILKTEIKNTVSKQYMLVSVAVMSMLIAGIEPNLTVTTEDKKNLLATLLVQGHISANDRWYTTFNSTLPGEPLDLDNPSDQPYLINALERYTHEQTLKETKQKILYEVADIIALNTSESDFAFDAIDSLVESISPYISIHQNTPLYAEEQIDKIIREAGAPAELSKNIKLLAQEYTGKTAAGL